ncbi:MAG: family transporter protein [Bacteroidetes bacterium]|jgi:ABC-type transport system involved in multi-copper enzyme maturation permease subunit|nr:family transporter protein [Bacteroidota bacterium]
MTLGLIIRKEILDNFLNQRFAAACLVSILLMLSSMVVLTSSYLNEWRDYQSRAAMQEEFIERYGHWNRMQWMARQTQMPKHYQALVLGIDREPEQQNFVSNPVSALFSRLDFVAIVTVIMSLMAILFSYDAITGEREAGLLKQMLSMGAGRASILFGKLIGGTISLIVPFTIGVLSGILYLSVRSGLQLRWTDYGVFLILLVGSFFYISAFFALGMLISARSHSSGQALLKALFAWVVLVLFLPNVSPFLAAQLFRIPSAAKIEQETSWITSEERDQIVAQRGAELLRSQFPDLADFSSLSRNEVASRVGADPALKERYSQYTNAYDGLIGEVNRDQQAKARKIYEAFQAQSKYQEQLAIWIASLSPLADFVFLATDMTETGISADDHWGEEAGRFQQEIGSFARARYEKAKAENPAFDSNDYLDMRDRPRFVYQPEPLADRIARVLPQFGILVLFNFLFAAIAQASFSRYDVR